MLPGAGEEIRTPDIFLGKEVLYQLSYARIKEFLASGFLLQWDSVANALTTTLYMFIYTIRQFFSGLFLTLLKYLSISSSSSNSWIGIEPKSH